MPRAEKPIVYKSPPVAQVTLDQDRQDLLAKDLGIEKEKDKVKKMAARVEVILTRYKTQAKYPTPTLSSRITALKALREAALALLENIYPSKKPGAWNLESDFHTISLLYAYMDMCRSEPVEETPDENPFPGFTSDLEAVKRLYKLFDNAIKYFESQKREGRPWGQNDFTAMWKLVSIFILYNRNNKYKRKRLCAFINRALDATGIKHRDPSRGNFLSLVEKHTSLFSHTLFKPV